MPAFALAHVVKASSDSNASKQPTAEYRSRLGYSANLTMLEVLIQSSVMYAVLLQADQTLLLPHVIQSLLLQASIAVATSALLCAAFYLVKAPNHLSLKFALSVALLFSASLTVCRTFLLERKHQVKGQCMPPALSSIKHARIILFLALDFLCLQSTLKISKLQWRVCTDQKVCCPNLVINLNNVPDQHGRHYQHEHFKSAGCDVGTSVGRARAERP